MNEKVNFLRFFFESGKYAEEAPITEKIADFFPALIILYDVDEKKIRYVNNKFREYFGDMMEDLKNSEDPMTDLVFRDDADLINDALECFHSLRDNETYCFNCRFNHQTDRWRYFKTSGTVLRRSVDGKARLLLLVGQDITYEVNKKEETDTKIYLFNETEDLLQFGSWSWDTKTNEVKWTNGLYKILGYSEAELNGKITQQFYMDHVVEEYREPLRQIVSQSVENRSDFDFEYLIKTKTGTIKTVSTTGKVIIDHAHDTVKVLGITRDVTSIRNFEKEQERNVRELNRSNRELEEFAYVASHDLQEPLRKIAMFSERLQSKYGASLDKEGQLFMDRILASAGNMRLLIDNLLEFSRANRSSQAFALVSLHNIVKEVAGSLEHIIEETGTTIEVPEPLPQMEAVSSQMLQLFNNLLSNAIKFRKTSVSPLIRFTWHRASYEEKNKYHLPADKTYFVIEVTDNGIGFEEEYAERIFQIFQRLHGKTEYPGTGIGLAICKKIADNHSGLIYAHGVPGTGATFILVLPEKQL